MWKLTGLLAGLIFCAGQSWGQANEAEPEEQLPAKAEEVYDDTKDDLGFGGGEWKLFIMDKVGATVSKDGVGAEFMFSLALFSSDVLGLKEEGGELKEQPFPVLGIGYTVGFPEMGEVDRYQEVTVDFLLIGVGFGNHYYGSHELGRQVSVNIYAPYLYPKYPVSIFARSKFEDGEKTDQIYGLAVRVSLSSIFLLDHFYNY